MTNAVETGFYAWNHRLLPVNNIPALAQAAEESGVVDYFWQFDVLESWTPPALFSDEILPNAACDFDSWHDGSLICAYAAGFTKNLGIAFSTNAIRHNPAEVLQRCLTLADMAADQKMILALGAGEAYNTTPFGYKRSTGLACLEDHLRLYKLLLECDAPFDFDGNIWKYKGAYIGKVRNSRPKFYALGAGPKLIDIAAEHADGLWTCHNGFVSPEHYAAKVQEIRTKLDQNGRDPDAFGHALYVCTMLNEDRGAIEENFNNPVVKFNTAMWGKLNQRDWLPLGFDPVFPLDWNYSIHMNRSSPEWTVDRIREVNDAVTPEMVEAAWLIGSPEEVARQCQPYIEAGANLIVPFDIMPIAGLATMDISLAAGSTERVLELLRLLKKG